eukprot:bmy_19220T0
MGKSKLSSSIDIRNAFFSEVGIAISANTILLLFHVHTFLHEHRLKPTDLTISHLALIHMVMLVTMGFIGTDIFGSQKTWYDIKCKIGSLLVQVDEGPLHLYHLPAECPPGHHPQPQKLLFGKVQT